MSGRLLLHSVGIIGEQIYHCPVCSEVSNVVNVSSGPQFCNQLDICVSLLCRFWYIYIVLFHSDINELCV